MALVLLKEARKEAGLTQRELAERSGVSQNLIARLETGELKNATLKTMCKLAEALDKPVNDVFFADK